MAIPLRILVADDEASIRLSIQRYLELDGCQVAVASDGLEALEIMETFQPQLLLLDIKMPYKSGHEVVKQARQGTHFRYIPVIFMTCLGTTRDRIRGYEMGCDVYLTKPFELKELKAIIKMLAGRRQTLQSKQKVEESAVGLSYQKFSLTDRESDVLELVSIGLSNAEIGQKLFLSPRTVEKYVSRLLRKTDTTKRAELVRYALSVS